MQARPFIKWAGGKTRMLPVLKQHLPTKFATYYEPFVGGGAAFFALQPAKAVLADANMRLMRTYAGVRDHADAVVDRLRRSPHSKDFFLRVRGFDVDSADNASVASWLIYLSKTAFNGLYRVNRSGGFNVPFGDYANPTICDEVNLRACSEALKGVELVAADFEQTIERSVPGDLVYCDPPYLPTSATSSFTGYTADGFGLSDHRRLRDAALRAKARGVHVVISNSAAPAILDLYQDGFEVHRVSAPRSIAASGGSRGAVEELIIK
jgi:DNA adenine methylase